MSLSADAVIGILEDRYDYYSARTVLKQAAEAIGLDAKGPFDGPATKKLADAVARSGHRVDTVVAQLREAAPAEAAKKAKATPTKSEPPAAEEAADASAGEAEGGAKRTRRRK